MTSPLGDAFAHALFAQSPLSTIVYDLDGHITASNAAADRLFGMRIGDVPREYSLLTDPQLDARGVLPLVRRAFAGESVVLPPISYGPVPELGVTTRTWTQAHLSPLRDDAGTLTGVVLVHVDLTAQMAAQETVTASEMRLRLALDAAGAGAWEWDVVTGRVTWSDVLERMHGIPVGSFGGTFDDYQRDIHPDDRAHVFAQVSRTLAGEPHRLDYRIVRPDGEVRWLRAIGQLVRDPDGQPVRLVGICTDVTDERREAELAARVASLADDLAAQARDTSAILESITDPFVVYDPAWRFRYINESARAVFSRIGGAPDDTAPLGDVLWETYPEIVGGSLERAMRHAMQSRVPISIEHVYEPTGQWSEVHCYPMPDGGLATTWRDITTRKKAERAEHFLAEATAMLASSLDYERTLASLAELVVPQLADWCRIDVATGDGGFRQLVVAHRDPAKVAYAWEIERRFPQDPNGTSGVPNVLRTGVAELVREITDEMLVAGIPDPEYLRIIRELGLRSVIIVPLVAHDRVLGAVTLIASDESGRRYGESDLQLAQELARRAALAIDNAQLHRAAVDAERAAAAANLSKTQFLAAMSHELRTPLNAIGGYAELLLLGVRGEITAAQREDIERIARSQRHLLGVINDILNFARLEAGHVEYAPQAVAVRDLLVDVEPLVAPQIVMKALTFEWDAGPSDAVVDADPEKVRQILLNLLANAIKFTPSGGRVWIETRLEPARVAIRVHDTGIGIPAERLEHVFEPFVQVHRTLASPTEGTGLGLAISRDLARGMRGDIAAESTLGTGSVFTLTLPRA